MVGTFLGFKMSKSRERERERERTKKKKTKVKKGRKKKEERTWKHEKTPQILVSFFFWPYFTIQLGKNEIFG